MLGLAVPLEHAQLVKEYLLKHELLHKEYRPVKTDATIIFPVHREFNAPWEFDVEFVDAEHEETEKTGTLKDALAPLLTTKELDDLIASYDIVGSIAIIEIPDSLALKETIIANKVMEINKSVTTVLKKIGGHEGEYRVQRMACLAGEDVRETQVIENGMRLKVNVEEAYYSVRMSTERRRIADMVRPGENILCLFSGVAPYPIMFSKHTEADSIVGVEINPVAHALALENIGHNRCTNVRLIRGDAHDVVPRLAANKETFDRITMPLPHTAEEFLDDAISVSKPGTIIHYYSFQHEDEAEKAVETVREALRRNRRAIGSYAVVKAGAHAPRILRICVDAQVA